MSDRAPTLLAVFAHPDDESFRCGGTMALLSKRGVRVQILTATRGESGSCGDPPLCPLHELGKVREQELRCACVTLGISAPRFMGFYDGKLPEVDQQIAVAQLIKVIAELKPDVLLTWPLHGLSGHPDHCAVSRWTTLAYKQATRDTGLEMALYYLTVPHSVANALNMKQLHSIPDKEVTLTVNVLETMGQKLTAIHCHRTQIQNSPILFDTAIRKNLFLGIEHFLRVERNTKRDLLQSIESSLVSEAHG